MYGYLVRPYCSQMRPTVTGVALSVCLSVFLSVYCAKAAEPIDHRPICHLGR